MPLGILNIKASRITHNDDYIEDYIDDYTDDYTDDLICLCINWLPQIDLLSTMKLTYEFGLYIVWLNFVWLCIVWVKIK